MSSLYNPIKVLFTSHILVSHIKLILHLCLLSNKKNLPCIRCDIQKKLSILKRINLYKSLPLRLYFDQFITISLSIHPTLKKLITNNEYLIDFK